MSSEVPQDQYIIAVDVGGTCTDCVIFCNEQSIHFGKALSTPPNFAQGVLESVRVTAADMGLSLEQLLASSSLFVHGSTVVDNAIFERAGVPTGLITTAGFEDTLLVMRGGYGRWSGQPEEVIKHPVASNRPRPLVPCTSIVGVRERVDYKGAVLLPLKIEDVERAVDRLVRNKQVEAIAVCFLWSFRNPQHELQVRDIVRRRAPHVHVALSSDVATTIGEYERTSATVIDAYVGPVTQAYLNDLMQRLASNSYRNAILVMQGYGGLVPIAEAAARPLRMLECGPAAGIIGAQYLAHVMGHANVIAADMGGTTFKVGVIQDGRYEYSREPMVDRFHYTAPKIDVVSIGAGGGSIVGFDWRINRPTVGPASAGADPGPICYGLGGTEPTLTDVAAILGYMDANTFLGGTLKLEIERTREVFAEKVAKPLDMGVEEAALGIYRIAVAQTADLIRKVTVERGLDPRDFVLQSFGGCGGLFAGAYARDLGVVSVIIPDTAAVLCAFGMVASDVLHDYSTACAMPMTVDPKPINAIMAPMERHARDQLSKEGFPSERIVFEWFVEMRYGRQVHQVSTPFRGQYPMNSADLPKLQIEFEQLYEQRYGRGSSYRAAGIELVTFRLKARGLMNWLRMEATPLGASNCDHAERGVRSIVNEKTGLKQAVKVYDLERMSPGNMVRGPTVIHSSMTTIVVPEGQAARLDGLRNLIMEAA